MYCRVTGLKLPLTGHRLSKKFFLYVVVMIQSFSVLSYMTAREEYS